MRTINPASPEEVLAQAAAAIEPKLAMLEARRRAYLLMTKLSETVLGKLSRKLSRGQATFAGEQQRKAAA